MKSIAFIVLGSNQPIYHICCGVNPLHYSQSACLGLSDSSFIISYTAQQPLPWLNWHDMRQSSRSKFEVKVGGSCCSLSQLREPSNWKGDSATLFSQRLHCISETITGLWTSLFNSFSQLFHAQSQAKTLKYTAADLDFSLCLGVTQGLTWHLDSGLMGASSSLSHTPGDVWLFEHFHHDSYFLTGEMKAGEKPLREDRLFIDTGQFPGRNLTYFYSYFLNRSTFSERLSAPTKGHITVDVRRMCLFHVVPICISIQTLNEEEITACKRVFWYFSPKFNIQIRWNLLFKHSNDLWLFPIFYLASRQYWAQLNRIQFCPDSATSTTDII